jgi:hypothetical protein
VYKLKSTLNLREHKVIRVKNDDDTYSPVEFWQNIMLFLILAAMNSWHSNHIDLVVAFTNAGIATTTYMELPPGVSYQTYEKINTASLSLRISMVTRTQENMV